MITIRHVQRLEDGKVIKDEYEIERFDTFFGSKRFIDCMNLNVEELKSIADYYKSLEKSKIPSNGLSDEESKSRGRDASEPCPRHGVRHHICA